MTLWTDLLGTEFCVRYVDARGTRTRALQAGEGPDVIFLHGTGGHLEAFSRNIAVHARHYRCHAIDMLGHGLTAPAEYPYEIPRYVEHLLAYMDAMGIEKANLVGESLGGWVAGRAACDAPDRVASLELIAPGGSKANPRVMETLRTTTTAAVISGDRSKTKERLDLLMFDPEKDVSEELVDVRFAIYQQPSFKEHLDQLLCLQDIEVRPRNLFTDEMLASIKCPTLIVWGFNNPFGDVPEARELHERIPGSRLELFEECGHWPQHEQAERFNGLSLDFLAAAN